MFRRLPRRATTAAVFLLPAIGALPAQAAEKTSAPIYRSAFDNYRAWRAEEPSAGWRRANDEMGQLGGHAGHLRGAPATPPSSATPPSRAGDAQQAEDRPPHGMGGALMHDRHGMPRHGAPAQDGTSKREGGGR
jgi:hypothetical protein